MNQNNDVRRLLRWYPSNWRSRYGDEFLALLEERLDQSPPTIRFRSSVAIAGVRERCYGSGLVGGRSTPATQRRSGSLLVLVAWSIMVVGGASLVKTAEHFPAALPSASQAPATFAYDATAVAGIVGTLLVLAGVIVALPGFMRFLRESKWQQVRQTFVRSLVASVVLIASTIGLSLWARGLSTAQRNGADLIYSAAFLTIVLFVAITIGLWTRVSVAVASRIDFTPRELRWESYLALGVSTSIVAVVGSATAWWIQMGQHAPWFLSGTSTGVATSPWSAHMVVTVFVMALATATGLWGGVRVAMTYRPTRLNTQ